MRHQKISLKRRDSSVTRSKSLLPSHKYAKASLSQIPFLYFMILCLSLKFFILRNINITFDHVIAINHADKRGDQL